MQQGVSPLFVKKGREKEKVFLEIDLLSPNPQPHLITASSLIRRIPCTLEAAVIFSAGKKRKKKKTHLMPFCQILSQAAHVILFQGLTTEL